MGQGAGPAGRISYRLSPLDLLLALSPRSPIFIFFGWDVAHLVVDNTQTPITAPDQTLDQGWWEHIGMVNSSSCNGKTQALSTFQMEEEAWERSLGKKLGKGNSRKYAVWRK
ncbi:uncharacterized protein N7500_004730 [Penicillium coprophilum]|uniref:uncharacterized protein n=1 Tax=Penicillium coprophilum TaxID=36646 RepID=UPI00238DBBC8|nr:uncharacterized protein N7500_004730 [Penicillium coprophilum]KAJ5162900.1 hypothetical protein N7500_004730 [Penicillium coprophilum]